MDWLMKDSNHRRITAQDLIWEMKLIQQQLHKMKNKMTNNKIAKGIVSLTIIVVLLLSVLAGSFYYQNNITANAVKEASADFDKNILIKEIDAKNLNQLNEGWYKTINGNLFYLEGFDRPVYLYARINNPEYKNEIFSVDADRNLEFFGNNSLNNGNNKPKLTSNNQISGNVVGMESVSGFDTAQSLAIAKSNGLTIQRLGVTNNNNAPQTIVLQPTGPAIPREYKLFNTPSSDPVLKSFVGYYYDPQAGVYNTGLPKSFLIPSNGEVYNYGNTKLSVTVTQGFPSASGYTYTLSTPAPTTVAPASSPDKPLLTAENQRNLVVEVSAAAGVPPPVQAAGQTPQAQAAAAAVPAALTAPAAPTTAVAAPGAPTSPTAPVAPTRVYTKPEDIPVGGNSYTKVGDSWYYKFPDGKIIKSVDGTKDNYEPYKITFAVSWTDASGNHVVNVPAESKDKLLQDFKLTHPNTNPDIQPASGSVAPSPVSNPNQISQPRLDSLTKFYVVTVGNKDMSFNNQGDAQKYYNEQTAIADVNKAWDDWVKQGNANTEENKAAFAQHLSSELKQSLNSKQLDPTAFANQVLQVKSTATNPQQQSSQTPYTKVQFPDGTWRYTYQGTNYDTIEDQVPPTLTRALNFENNYVKKGAQPVTNLKDSAGNQIYSFKGKYVSIASDDVPQGIREEDIGGVKYPVTYSLANGRMAAAGIKLGDEPSTPITDLQLRQLRSYGKVSGNLIKNSEGRLQFSFTSPPKKVGDNEQTSTTNVEFFAKGPTETKTIQVKDRNGNIISLKETTNEYYEETTTATGEKRYVFGLSSQKNYKLGEGETSINPMTSDYTEITTDPATGQPTKLTIREKGIESSAQYVNGQVTGTGKAKDRLSTEISQYKSRQFFAGFQFIFTEFRGLGYIPSLFGFDDDSLIEWRNGGIYPRP